MSGFEEYADAQARADDGLPAQPGDAEVIAAGDERLGWAHTEYVARRHDEAIKEMAADQPADIEITRRMAYALAMAHIAREIAGYAPVETWHDLAGQAGTQALADLGLLRRGLAEQGEWTGCLYLTDAGRRAVRVALDRADNSLYLHRPKADWPPGEGISDEDFAAVVAQILAAASREETRYEAPRQDEADWERLDPVGIPEIATRLGVERQTVDQWRLRGRLPAPDRVVGGRPVWAWATICGWAVRTGRLPEDG